MELSNFEHGLAGEVLVLSWGGRGQGHVTS